MSTPHMPCGKREEIELRRVEVARLRIEQCLSIRDIAVALKIGRQTAFRDLQAVMAEARVRREKLGDDLLTLEMEKLDHYERALQPGISSAEQNTVNNSVHALLAVHDRRARLMGWGASNASLSLALGEGRQFTLDIGRPGAKQIESRVIDAQPQLESA